MTPLRQRFIEDLQLRNYAARTVKTYVACVAKFATHFRRSPAELGREDIRAFQLHLIRQKVSWSQFNQIVCALRFLYGTTLEQAGLVDMVPYGKKPKTLPSVLSREEVERLFAAAKNGRDRMLFRTTYAAGLRISEVVRLRLEDIDSARTVLHIRQAKGGKDREVPLSPRLLGELRGYWREHRPKEWLFPGRDGHLSIGSVQKMCKKAVRACGFGKQVSMHTLRHSYATHLLEAGVDVITLQRWLGHRHLSTTACYTHVRHDHVQTMSPLDLLPSSGDRRP
jgi:integrase/recombinase XerD